MPDLGVGQNSKPMRGPLGIAVTVLCCVAIYNVFELTCILWVMFRRHSGLYFWSFVIATGGVFLNALAFIIKTELPQITVYVYISIGWIGWMAMVTGQSLVLWSRLHLLMHNPRILRLVLAMIIINAILWYIPSAVLAYGSNQPHHRMSFQIPFGIVEKIQVSFIFAQETIINLLYIREALRLMRDEKSLINGSRGTRSYLNHLILINIAIIVIDLGIIVIEYNSLYALQTAYKAFAYSVKLKLEFTILNQLVEVTRGTYGTRTLPGGNSTLQKRPHGLPLASSSGSDSSRFAYRANYLAFARRNDGWTSASCSPAQRSSTPDTEGVVMTKEVIVEREAMPEVPMPAFIYPDGALSPNSLERLHSHIDDETITRELCQAPELHLGIGWI